MDYPDLSGLKLKTAFSVTVNFYLVLLLLPSYSKKHVDEEQGAQCQVTVSAAAL